MNPNDIGNADITTIGLGQALHLLPTKLEQTEGTKEWHICF